MTLVANYLDEMEVPKYFTNLMLSRSSQDAYLVSRVEVDDLDHPLSGYVPSIEEITLSRCAVASKQVSSLAGALASKGRQISKKEMVTLQRLAEEERKGWKCQDDVVSQMRREALAKEFPGSAWWK